MHHIGFLHLSLCLVCANQALVRIYRPSSPCSRETEVERIARLQFKYESADSQSMIIFFTDDGSLDIVSDPAAIAA